LIWGSDAPFTTKESALPLTVIAAAPDPKFTRLTKNVPTKSLLLTPEYGLLSKRSNPPELPPALGETPPTQFTPPDHSPAVIFVQVCHATTFNETTATAESLNPSFTLKLN
jgi:hypothetical protein